MIIGQEQRSAAAPTGRSQQNAAEDVRIGHEARKAAPPSHTLDARAWLVWLAATTVIGFVLFNPWYHLVMIGIVVVVWPHTPQNGSVSGILRLPTLITAGVVAVVLGGVFNMIVVRVGELVLFHLPDAIPILGGMYTVEALTYGVLNALRFVAILFVFALFNRMVAYPDLLRLLPAGLVELGLMLSISFTLAPMMLRAFQDIREAQALRGHKARGLRDLPPLLMPLIVTGLERALALAETMEARGFGGRDQRDAWRSGALYAGIIGLLTLSIVNVFIALPAFLLCPMLVCLGSLSWLGVRRKKRQAARRVRWAAAAWCIALGPLAALGVVLLSERALLVYDVYAMAWAGLPPFDPWIAIALFGIATPGLVMRSSRLRNGDPA